MSDSQIYGQKCIMQWSGVPVYGDCDCDFGFDSHEWRRSEGTGREQTRMVRKRGGIRRQMAPSQLEPRGEGGWAWMKPSSRCFIADESVRKLTLEEWTGQDGQAVSTQLTR